MLALSLALAATFVQTPADAPAVQDTAYFQQRVEYRIEARLDESADVLNGLLQLQYHNNAPAAIDTLWFHLHLNAFRPNSSWARRELEYDERRFTDLGPDEHAFERVHRVAIAGADVTPLYPGAPDSTVMGVALPQPLQPGGVVTVDIAWDARPSTLPRRQGRRGRHYDFAQWYPRIAVYDRGGWAVQPLMPQGEFYGEFGSYDVSLDVAADQVLGATGVPIEGDPGWAAAAAATRSEPRLQRDAYSATSPTSLGLIPAQLADGRRHVRWRAEDVHHFAWTANPEYIYEGGVHRDIAVHVLYQPGDTAWDNGVAVERTIAALDWFEGVFGPYPWPQITNVHRIESGGTEFPMMIMNGSASEGLILHEVGHNFVHGILANNEWREGWLDEGFVSFLTNWAHEEAGREVNWDRSLDAIRRMEREGLTQPIGLPSADFRDPSTYSAMTYTKPSLVFRMLRWMIGEDSFRAGLRTLYSEHALQHFTEADLHAAFSAASGQDLGPFFEQWIHTTGTLDYRLGDVQAEQAADGSWVTRAEVFRDGDIRMPVDIRVGDTVHRLPSGEPRQSVTVTTQNRPDAVTLDPDNILLDLDPANNRRSLPR